MRIGVKALVIASLAPAGIVVGQVSADENATLVIEGEEMVTRAATPEWHPLPETLSGWLFRSSSTQALEMDDFENPAFAAITLARGNLGDASGQLAAVLRRLPRCNRGQHGRRARRDAEVNEAAGEPGARRLHQPLGGRASGRGGVEVGERGNARHDRLYRPPVRGMPVNVQIDGPMAEWWKKGEELYYTRVGQLDLSCAHCHEYTTAT